MRKRWDESIYSTSKTIILNLNVEVSSNRIHRPIQDRIVAFSLALSTVFIHKTSSLEKIKPTILTGLSPNFGVLK